MSASPRPVAAFAFPRGPRASGAVSRAPLAAQGATAVDPRVVAASLVVLGVVAGAGVAAGGLNALVLGGALVGCAFVLNDFRVGVMLLTLLFPLSRSYLFPHAMLGVTGLNPLNVLLAGTAGACLAAAVADARLRRLAPAPLLLLYVAPIVAGGLAGSGHLHEIVPGVFGYDLGFDDVGSYLMEMVLKPLTLVAFALLVGAAAVRSERPERLLLPFIAATWIICLVVIVFVATSGVALAHLASSSGREYLSALGPHANEFGHLYAVTFGLLLFAWQATTERWLRGALGLTLVVVLVALLLTFSRSAYGATAVIVAIYLLGQRRFRTLLAVLLAAGVGLLLAPDAFYERLVTGAGGGIDAISAGRIDRLWLPLLPEVLKHPVFGNGLGSIHWSEVMRNGAGGAVLAVSHPHNAYLEALLDLGVAGTLCLCSFFVLTLRDFRRLQADPSLPPVLRGFLRGGAAALAGLLVADFADNSLLPRSEQVPLWFAIGMMYGLRQRRPTC